MAALGKTALEVKFNDASTGLFKANTSQNRVTSQDRQLVEDLADSVLFKTDEDAYLTFAVTASGTDTYTATPSPVIAAYTSYHRFFVLFTNANTGAATLNLAGLGAKAIKKSGTTALDAGDIAAGQILVLVYDGTNFQVVGGGGGSAGDFVDMETPSGTINSSNTGFTIANTPIAGSVHVFYNGLLQKGGGDDYSISGTTITFTTAPETGSTLLVSYRK